MRLVRRFYYAQIPWRSTLKAKGEIRMKNYLKMLQTAPLTLNLQHFAEPGGEETPPTNPEQQPEGGDNPANPTKQDDVSKTPEEKEIMIPKSRFDEINEQKKAAQDELNKIKQAQEQAKIDQQKEQGKFEDLYNQASEEVQKFKGNFEQANTRVEQLEGVITSMLETKLESIPKEYHDLIPDNLSPEAKLDWISKADAKGLFVDKSKTPVGGLTNPTKQTDMENMTHSQLLAMGYSNKK